MQTPSAEGSLWDSFTLPITEHPDPARDLLFLEAHPDPKSITEARKGVIVALRGMGVTLEREGEQGLSASFAQPKTNDRALVIDTLSDLSSLNTAFSLSMAGVDNLKSYFDHLKMYYEKLMADGETDR
ncbi:MAG: hypothetical protein OEY44_04160, partial [Candidatus Peregrinibacteria bacterium]|nr:hypothetical protein [Candidatus Peregrinibacteria bacterium]